MKGCCVLAGLGVLLCSISASAANAPAVDPAPCSVFRQKALSDCRPVTVYSFVDSVDHADTSVRNSSVLGEAFSALATLQNHYFEPINGTWPTSIDWTGAVVQTVISGMLTSMSKSLKLEEERNYNWTQKEKLVSSIFAQITHSFFGQNAVGILDEAYDDVLWVVLGWLEAVKFVGFHSDGHYPGSEQECLHVPIQLGAALNTTSWHGFNWVCSFAQRARAFWDFATNGWDTKLCQGGMIWNPRLVPYKNAITNELWIAASISMHEFFPQDKFNKTWASAKGFPDNDPVYLAAAVEGYKWLKDVNMTNDQGLYFDGYHVDMRKAGNAKCDQPDKMVYTYNQGVILTGQRGLFAATGSPSYLEEGHQLIQNVINATGWDLRKNVPVDDIRDPNHGQLPPWRGIGRYGIMEENCDATGTCSQDAQTFKGIFFHHLTTFCAPITPSGLTANMAIHAREFGAVQAAHDQACNAYVKWVKHNVDAALETRDKAGRYGMWWGAGIFHHVEPTDAVSQPWPNVTDYRNRGTPRDATWGLNVTWKPGRKSAITACQDLMVAPDPSKRGGVSLTSGANSQVSLGAPHERAGDPNDRGRGRTVETQAGGLALLRAYWELSQR